MSSGDINDQAPGGFRRPSSHHHPFHFHTQPYPLDPQPRPWAAAHQNPPSASTAPSPSLPAMPSDTLPLFSPNPLTSYPHPLGAWNATFPPTAQHPPPVPTQSHTQPQAFDGGTDDVYYPTGYNIGMFPFVPPSHPVQGQALHHSYPHAYTQTRHQIVPSPLRRVQLHRRDPYTALSQMQENQENESPASQPQQPQQQQHQRTDPEQSKTQLIIHQRTQELLAQATLSSTSSLDCQATTDNRTDSGSGGAAMQSVGEHRPGSSSTVQQRPGHVGIPFLFGSVEEALYGVPSSSIGQVMGKPTTGAGTGTTFHLRDMDTMRVPQVPISASERQGQTRVSEPRDPSTHPPSPPGGFVGCTPPGDMQAPLMSDGGPGSGPEGSLSIHPNPHAESQGSHTHTHDTHANSQSSHAHSYIQKHSSYIHPRSHSSHSPASYASYPTTGSSIDYSTGGYSTTGSSAGEHPPTASSADEYPTTGGYLPNASLVENYHPTGSSVPAVDEMSISVSGQAEGNIGVTRGRESGYGHGHSESVSTVRGLPMSSSHQYHGYGAHSVSSAPSTASEQAEQAGGLGYSPNSAQHVSVSTEFVLPTFQSRVQGQTQQRAARKVHQYPPRRGRNHRPEQGSGLPPYPHGASTARGNVSQSGKGQGQSAGRLQPQESAPSRTRSGSATTGAAPTTRKRARAPKRLRAGLTSNASATSVPIGGGGGDSDDDSDDEEDCEPSSTGFGGPGASRGPDAGATGGGQGNTGGETGVAGPRKAGACSHCKRLKMKCEFPEGATSCRRCTHSGYACIVEGRKPRIVPNKREYLLAQIRHKDQMIESLLKQLHNPYTATPLSISAFKTATSPSDKDNVKIVDWMDRLQSSTKPPTQPCPSRMEMLRELRDTHNNAGGVGDNSMEDSDEIEEGDETTEGEETEKVRGTLPDAAVPIGLLASLSLDKDKGKGRASQSAGTPSTNTKLEEDDDNVGVANKEYFMPGLANNLNIRKNLIEQHSPPDIVLHGLVTAADVEKLFEIFWGKINPFISLLDRKVHTPTTIFQRCPFLFTVICAISSRYYDKSEIYPVAMHFAKHAAANALIDGWKSVELCQAYILMSLYTVPARRWEEDRSWLYTGLAIRIATDLSLHQVSEIRPTTERQERELLNRIRVWMICFNLDRSTATQFGKPSTIKEDYIIRNANWYKKSPHNDKYDIHLCGYTALLRIVAQFHDDVFSDPDSPTGLNRSIDFLTVTLEHDNRLTLYFDEWTKRFNEDSDHTDPGSAFRCKLLPFLVNYSRLVMYSFGFQHAFQRGMESNDQIFLEKCFDAATAVIEHVVEVLAPSGFMRSSPDGHFVFASFASAFLLKLLRPEFAQFLTHKMEDEIFESISRLITTLQELAIDERHTPHLYARFLASLLTKHRKGGAGVGGHPQSQPPASQSVHKPSTQPRGYGGQQCISSPSRLHYSGLSSQDSSYPRYDSDNMQMNGSPFPGTSRSPPPATTPPMPAANAPGPEYLGEPGMDDMLTDIGALASMRALNDVWWGNMMMPGFTWPDTPLTSSLHDGPSTGLSSGHHPAFEAFAAPETRVAM